MIRLSWQRLSSALVATMVLCSVLTVVAFRSGDDGQAPSIVPPERASPTPQRPSLRSLIPATVRIGSAVSARALQEDSAYRKILAEEFNSITPENAMKWASLETERGVYNWEQSDKLMAFAGANGQAVYGHTLVWHSDVPAWISDRVSAAVLQDTLRRHIIDVVTRYKGRVWAWDVVNEVLAEDGSLRDTIWLRVLGPGYIANAFRWAHEADPGALLFINEYGVEGSTAKADALLSLVKRLRSQGVPVHGVGFQSHFANDRVPSDMVDNLGRFARLGLRLAITELDVRIELPTSAEKLERQASGYRDVLNACLSVVACVSVTVWGFTDHYSWIPSYHKGYGAACLFDESYQPKPAFHELIKTLLPRLAFR